MRRRLLLAAALTVACGGDKPAAGGAAAGAGEAPATAAPAPRAAPEPGRVIPGGTVFTVMTNDPLASLVDKPGDVFQVVVRGNVMGPDGALLIPSGAILDVRIDRLEATGNPAAPARIELSPVRVQFEGMATRLKGTIDAVPFVARDNNIIVERATALTVRVQSVAQVGR